MTNTTSLHGSWILSRHIKTELNRDKDILTNKLIIELNTDGHSLRSEWYMRQYIHTHNSLTEAIVLYDSVFYLCLYRRPCWSEARGQLHRQWSTFPGQPPSSSYIINTKSGPHRPVFSLSVNPAGNTVIGWRSLSILRRHLGWLNVEICPVVCSSFDVTVLRLFSPNLLFRYSRDKLRMLCHKRVMSGHSSVTVFFVLLYFNYLIHVIDYCIFDTNRVNMFLNLFVPILNPLR